MTIPVLWHRGRVTHLSQDVRYARPLDLSDSGHVVGEYYQLTEPRGVYPFAWSRGDWTQLASGEDTEWGLDVNRRGQVVGRLDRPPYTVVWDDGEPIPPPPGAGYGLINDRGQMLGGVAINESGDIAGNSLTAGGEEHAFLWRDGEMIDLGTVGGWRSEAADINERGDVVGTAVTADGEAHGFLWRDGEMIDLGSLGSTDTYPASEAVALNNRGQVVGNLYGDWPNEAVLWTAPPR